MQCNDTRLSTCLEANGARVATVEHLMSALAGLGIDNAIVELTSPELPIMDGSAGTFIFLLQSAGIVEQAAAKKFIRIKKTVEVKDGDKWVRFEPYNGYKLNFTINFAHPVFANTKQNVTVDLGLAVLYKGSEPRQNLRFHAGSRIHALAGTGAGRQPG